MKNNVKNLLFDLGNVLFDLDIDRTWQQLAHWLGDSSIERAMSETELFVRFEVGKMTETEFFDALRSKSAAPLSIRTLKEAWNAMLLQMPKARLEMLLRLKERYQVGLLSNTNETHIEWIHGYLDYSYGVTDFETRYFHHAFYSHDLQLRKPNVAIYETVLAKTGWNAAETLFIDDNAANIEGAKKAGLQTMLHPVGVEIMTVLADF